MATNNKTIARNTIFLYVRMILVLVVTLFTTRVLLKGLGEVDFGIYNVVAGVVMFFSFFNASLSACIQRYYNYEHGKNGNEGINNVFITSCFIQIALSLVILLIAESIGVWYIYNVLVVPIEKLGVSMFLFQCSVLSLIIVILGVPFSSAIMAYEKMDYFAYIGVIDVLLKLGIAYVTLIYSGDRLSLYGALIVLVSIIDFLLYYIYVKRKFKFLKFKFRFNKQLIVEMLKFASFSMFGSFAMIIRNQGLSLLLNSFFGPVINAARAISYQIKGGIVGFINNIHVATRPQIVESFAQENFDRCIKLAFTSSKICYYMMYMMILPIAYNMDFILKLWLGKEIPPYTSIFSILILIIGLVDALNPPVTTMIYSTGKIGKYNIMTGLIGILVLPVSYVALKLTSSPTSTYIISILISILVQAYSVKCLNSIFGLPIMKYAKEVVWPCLAVTFLTVLIPLLFCNIIINPFYKLGLIIILSVVTVGIAAYFIGLNGKERELFLSFVKHFISKRKHSK